MILGVFLAIGESWEEFEKIGQDKLLINNNYSYYSRNFEKVFIFSYGKKSAQVLPNVYILGNKSGIHRFIYSLLIPFIYYQQIRESSILRGMQLTGAIPAVVAKLLLRKKFVFNYGYDYVKYARIEGKPVRVMCLGLLNKITEKSADKIIITTSALAQNFPLKKTVVIPNSIDTEIFKPIKTDKVIDILFVGRLTKQKNLEMLLKAVYLTGQKLKIVFVGSGKEKDNLIKKACHLEIDLQILNNISHDELPKLYNRARLFILPSLIEGHPKALLEAMSCGLTVIGTDVDGINNLIKHRETGLLVGLYPDKLALAINTLLNSSQLRKNLGQTARKFILNHYDNRKIWQKEISLLKSFI